MLFFFFSSRRRHTRYIGDWSSDVCSSDLIYDAAGVAGVVDVVVEHALAAAAPVTVLVPVAREQHAARSEERRVGKSVDVGGRRVIKKKKTTEVMSISQ